MKKHTKSGLYIAVLMVFILALFSGCAKTMMPAIREICSQKVALEDRTRITVLVKYAFSINAFEKIVEEKFPKIDLIQVGNFTSDMGKAEYAARLEHDDLTDIVMTWPLNVGEQYWEDRLLDLSSMDFTSNYHLSMLDTISRDGKLYYLPGPAQVRGIVYNKTMFEENGWQVPSNYEEFKILCQTIEDTGIRALMLGFKNSEVLDTAFIGYGYGQSFSELQDAQFLAEYNNGKGSFGNQYGPALDTFEDMINAGIFKPEDLEVGYSEREKKLFTRKCAMVEDSALMAKMGYDLSGSTDEFALMPFFNPGEEKSDWARLYMVCYIGLNKKLAEPYNKEKYDLVLELMDYISTPEGQMALAGDNEAMYSSLNDVLPPYIPQIKDLYKTLADGRYSIFPEFKNAQSALREGLAGMLRGDTTKEQVIRMVDSQNTKSISEAPIEILGQASTRFTLIDTGSFVTDAMRKYSGCEIALFLDNGKDGKYNGKGISATIYPGDVTSVDIARILPDLKYGDNGELWKITMSGRDIIETLEYAITTDNNAKGWYYYFSGLKITYDPVAEPGKRISDITTADGNVIEPTKMYTVAIMNDTVPAATIKTCEKTGITIAEVVSEAVKQAGTISPSEDGRFTLG